MAEGAEASVSTVWKGEGMSALKRLMFWKRAEVAPPPAALKEAETGHPIIDEYFAAKAAWDGARKAPSSAPIAERFAADVRYTAACRRYMVARADYEALIDATAKLAPSNSKGDGTP